jgi:aspartyl-tRNA synthetase
VVEVWICRLQDSPQANWEFAQSFFRTLPKALAKKAEGTVLMLDSSKPVQGMAALGHEGFAAFTEGCKDLGEMEDGDLLLFQARPRGPLYGGSTVLGELRTLMYRQAVEAGLLPRDDRFEFVWITEFPMFTPNDGSGPGQGGSAGFSSTHHPFTAPLTQEDFEMLRTNPLGATADHYDLVLNGVELGGGSRRIHVARMQEFVLRNVLKMSENGVAQFSHLLEALRSGCPPHAGFALGVDRFAAVLSGSPSIRDVTLFPKSMKGEDLMVKSPGKLTEEELERYHLTMRRKEKVA